MHTKTKILAKTDTETESFQSLVQICFNTEYYSLITFTILVIEITFVSARRGRLDPASLNATNVISITNIVNVIRLYYLVLKYI